MLFLFDKQLTHQTLSLRAQRSNPEWLDQTSDFLDSIIGSVNGTSMHHSCFVVKTTPRNDCLYKSFMYFMSHNQLPLQ